MNETPFGTIFPFDAMVNAEPAPAPVKDAGGKWRIGQHYGLHVYEGDRPVATFHRAEDAEAAVQAMNNAPVVPLFPAPLPEASAPAETGEPVAVRTMRRILGTQKAVLAGEIEVCSDGKANAYQAGERKALARLERTLRGLKLFDRPFATRPDQGETEEEEVERLTRELRVSDACNRGLVRLNEATEARVLTAETSLASMTAERDALAEEWATTYRAFKGAFDTPISRRRQNDEYAVDARNRLRAFSEAFARTVQADRAGEAS